LGNTAAGLSVRGWLLESDVGEGRLRGGESNLRRWRRWRKRKKEGGGEGEGGAGAEEEEENLWTPPIPIGPIVVPNTSNWGAYIFIIFKKYSSS
jgi:hypothetical protein